VITDLPPISVVGMHGGEVFGQSALTALQDADVVVASPRHLVEVHPGAGQQTIDLVGPLEAVLERIDVERSAARRVAIVASGDPGFFGVVRVLGERLGAAELRVYPAPSAVSLAFARVGHSWDDAVVVSAHGRPLTHAVRASLDQPKVAILTSPAQPPQALGRALLESGCRPRDVVVSSRLGERGESVTRTDLDGLAAGLFDPMSVVLLFDRAPCQQPGPTLSWGLPESSFAHRAGMITRSEVRAIAMGKLDLPTSGVLWDVGAGSGSVAIECARLLPCLTVIAIERAPADAERIRSNAVAHDVEVKVVMAEAPAAFADLPAPDRVFVGGGGIEVLEQALAMLRPGGRLVATHVLVERAAAAWRLLGNTVQVSVGRAVGIADGFRLQAENPIFVSWGPS
jgi:precorrin-6Y C5,15-methyltransferase (decarboxylating)